MGERYYITGVQLGMLIAFADIKEPKETHTLINKIIEKQFMGNIDTSWKLDLNDTSSTKTEQDGSACKNCGHDITCHDIHLFSGLVRCHKEGCKCEKFQESTKNEQWWMKGRPAQSKFTPEEILKRIDETKGKVCKCGHRASEHRQPHSYKLEMVCEVGGLGEQCNCKMFSENLKLNESEINGQGTVDRKEQKNDSINRLALNHPDIHSQNKDLLDNDYANTTNKVGGKHE